MPRWLYISLITAIFAPLVSLLWGQQSMAIFVCAAISLIPLAALISRATEDLEYYVGPIAGGLLNATFGNAPELIIGIFALQQGLLSVVKASIAGSIISNAMLVLGSSIALGGWRWGKQYFNARDAGQFSSMMVFAVAGLLLPTAATVVIKDEKHIEFVSIAISFILLVVYGMYLAAHVFHVRSSRRNPRHGGKNSRARTIKPVEKDEVAAIEEVKKEGSDEQKPPSPWLSTLMLLIATLGTAWNSELLVGTITPVTEQLGWTPVFIGLVLIPIVGNAAEHSSALYVAIRDRVDLSMAIAAGSSIQVATLVAPLLVLTSFFYRQHLALVFHPVELVALGVSAILFALLSLDGECSWLAGVQLVALYVMACVVFFFVPG